MKKMIKASILCAAVAMVVASGCSKFSSNANQTTAAETTAESAADAAADVQTESYADESSITLGEYKKIPVEVTKRDVTDSDVEAQINQVLAANPNYVEVDREAQDGDTVTIDYKGTVNGEEFSGGSAEGYILVLGSHTFIDGFEDGVAGMKVGENKDLNLKFPDGYGNKDLAGKDVVFNVTLQKVTEKKEAELNDEFVQKVAPDAETVDGYKAQIRKSLEDQAAQSKKSEMDQQILQKLVDSSTIVLGKEDVEKEFNSLLIRTTQQAQQYGIDFDTYASYMGTNADGLRKMLRAQAENTVKSRLVLGEVAAKENLKAEDSDRQAIASMYGFDNIDALKESYTDASDEDIDKDALYMKVMTFLEKNADVTEVEPTQAAAEETSAADESTADGESAEETTAAQ